MNYLAKPLTHEQAETVRAEIDRQKIVRSLVRVAVGNTTTPDEYKAMMALEQYKMQRYEQPVGFIRKLGGALLVGWAMLWLGLCGLSEYLTSWRA